MPDGMRKMGLCVLASLLLCDKKINAERQRSRGAEGKHTYRGCRIRADLLI